MKRDIFRRGVRMQHQFGSLEQVNDPLGMGTFEMPWPKRPDDLSKKNPGGFCEIQDYGEHTYRPHSSPVCKPNGGHASLQGPQPDYAQAVGMSIPVGTKRRLGPLKTDK